MLRELLSRLAIGRQIRFANALNNVVLDQVSQRAQSGIDCSVLGGNIGLELELKCLVDGIEIIDVDAESVNNG